MSGLALNFAVVTEVSAAIRIVTEDKTNTLFLIEVAEDVERGRSIEG